MSRGNAVSLSVMALHSFLKAQQPDESLSRDYISAFKLMDLYDIEQVLRVST